jgi:Flp pilus assembly protein TadG
MHPVRSATTRQQQEPESLRPVESPLRSMLRVASRRASRAVRVLGPARSSEASVLLESAITYALVIAIMIGAMDISYAFFADQNVADAARQASRWAAVRGSNSCANVPNLDDCGATSAEIQNYVQTLGYSGIAGSNMNVTTTWLAASSSTPTTWTACGSECNSPGNEVQVTVSYRFPLLLPFFRSTSVNFSSTGTMVISQ